MSRVGKFVAVVGIGCFAGATGALAQEATTKSSAANEGEIAEIIVTAQKRAQTENSVGMSISAVSQDSLLERGIVDTADLTKVVPGFTYTQSTTLTPVYSIRGVGFFDSSFGSSPAVSVYVDEVPVPFPIMSQGVSLDLERVEVLKGPQGTLFGENSTGGAVNYIAAKPSDTFKAGSDISFERFGRLDVSGFVTGPLTSTLNARLAVRVEEGGAWQYSYTRDARLGNHDKQFVRMILDWHPADKLKVAVNFNGFSDKSDTQAGQLIAIAPANPQFAIPALLNYPLAPQNGRAADWSPEWPNDNNNQEGQGSIRVDYSLPNSLTLTSLSSYGNMKVNSYFDSDGMNLQGLNYHNLGRIKEFNQEVRLALSTDRLNGIVGASYEHDHVYDDEQYFLADSTIGTPLKGIPAFDYLLVHPFVESFGSDNESIITSAAFANIDYRLTDPFSIEAGARFTSSRRRGEECTGTDDRYNGLGHLFEALEVIDVLTGVKTSPIVPIPQGACLAFDSTTTPTIAPYEIRLDEHNVSWRFGLDYKFDQGALVYANVSRGFKAGSLPTVAGANVSGYAPAVQEELTAYETGFKAPLFNRHLQLNGAAFYYDYKNKQVRGDYVDPLFGLQEKLYNVPKSRSWGLEGNIVAHPIEGLSLTSGISYVNSEIRSPFISINRQLQTADFDGSRLPFTPRLQGNADAQYEWSIPSGRRPFVGADVTYSSATNATLSVPGASASRFDIISYALLDLRAGLAASDGSWRLTFYGHNVTNKYYWNAVTSASDVTVRLAGRPATYGVMMSMRTR